MNANTGFTHEKTKNKTVEWYTPSWVFEEIGLRYDLDPAAPISGLPWIPADRFLCEADDGLIQPWSGRVWLNPPYGDKTAQWLAKMHQHGNGIALVFSRTDCGWFHDLCNHASGILFLRGRISFVDETGNKPPGKNGPGAGSILVSWDPVGSCECANALKRMAQNGKGVFWDLIACSLKVQDISKQGFLF